MKNQLIKLSAVVFLSVAMFGCLKQDVSPVAATSAFGQNFSFASAARSAADFIESKHDTVGKGFHHKMTKIDPATLPTVIKTHIAANYVGYTIQMAVKSDVDGNYGVGVKKDETHKLLSYDKNGVFLKELVRGDKGNKGKFPPNEVKITDLNKAVTDYVKAKYAAATIHRAFKDVNNNTIVILKDGEIARVLTFDANNVFVKADEFKKGDRGPKKG